MLRFQFTPSFGGGVIRFLTVPEGHNHSPIGTCDQMAFGNFAVMEKYMSIYDDIDRYLGVGGCRITAEETLYSCLLVNKIKTVRFPHNFSIIRKV